MRVTALISLLEFPQNRRTCIKDKKLLGITAKLCVLYMVSVFFCCIFTILADVSENRLCSEMLRSCKKTYTLYLMNWIFFKQSMYDFRGYRGLQGTHMDALNLCQPGWGQIMSSILLLPPPPQIFRPSAMPVLTRKYVKGLLESKACN